MHPCPVQGHGGRGFEHIAGCQFMGGMAKLRITSYSNRHVRGSQRVDLLL